MKKLLLLLFFLSYFCLVLNVQAQDGKEQITFDWWAGKLSAKELSSLFANRVKSDGGVIEAEQCLSNRIQALGTFYDKASAVWLPHGYKEGKFYAAKGGAGADLGFTRGGTRKRKGATYVEEVPYNLLQFSEQFDNAAWAKSNLTMALPVVTANQTTAPNGTLTADKIDFPASSGAGAFSLISQQPLTAVNGTFNFSVQLKGVIGGEVVWISGTPDGVTYQRTRCVLTTSWQRFSVSWTALSAAYYAQFGIDRRDASQTEVLGAQSIYVWGAQQNEGALRDYFSTTNRFHVPALDYTNSTCPSLSLEPARTNLLLQSEAFDNASWIKTAVTVTANATAGPENLSTADQLFETTANGLHYIAQTVTKAASSLQYTYSKSIKPIGRDWVLLEASDGVAHAVGKFFNVTTGAIGSTRITGTAFTLQDAKITPEANGFFRCSITITTNTVTSIIGQALLSTDGAVISYVGDVTKGVYLYGAQLEQASYASSYIKTEGATVSRVADAVTALTGVSNLIGQTEGTIYFEGSSFADGTDKTISLSDGTTNNRILIQFNTLNQIAVAIISGGITQGNINVGAFTSGTNYKLCVVYGPNRFALASNGSKIGEDLTVNVPALSQIRLDSGAGTGIFYGRKEALSISKTALTDAEAIAITQNSFETIGVFMILLVAGSYRKRNELFHNLKMTA